MVRLGFGFTPVLGDLIDLYEASTGKDFFSNEWLTPEQRFMSSMSVLAGSGQGYRYADKVAHAPKSYVRDVENKYRLIRNSDSHKALEKLSSDLRSKGIPDDWRVKVSKPKKGEQGLEFIHPTVDQTRVRVMPGNPKSPHLVSQKPYVKVQSGDKFYDKKGNLVENKNSESHIPLENFDFKNFFKD